MKVTRLDPRVPWVVLLISWLAFLAHTMSTEMRASSADERVATAESVIVVLAGMRDAERTRADSLAALMRLDGRAGSISGSSTCATTDAPGC